MPNYGDPLYWDDRYLRCKDSMFDWLEDYQALKKLLHTYLTSKDHKILILGCGNANFSEDLYDAGYENIWNIDISTICIE